VRHYTSFSFFPQCNRLIIEGNFDKWDATLTFPSTDATSGVLDIKIQAATVNTEVT
jgi:polyisoprenoid-binding protein YceI